MIVSVHGLGAPQGESAQTFALKGSTVNPGKVQCFSRSKLLVMKLLRLFLKRALSRER